VSLRRNINGRERARDFRERGRQKDRRRRVYEYNAKIVPWTRLYIHWRSLINFISKCLTRINYKMSTGNNNQIFSCHFYAFKTTLCQQNRVSPRYFCWLYIRTDCIPFPTTNCITWSHKSSNHHLLQKFSPHNKGSVSILTFILTSYTGTEEV